MKELTKFSIAVRESTLKRLKAVPEGSENWRINENSMSFANIARHIINSDRVLINAYHTGKLGKNLGQAHSIDIKNKDEMQKLMDELEVTKNKRAVFIEGLNKDDYLKTINVKRISCEEKMTLELLIYTMLDHETHHRGQLSVYLKMINKENK